MKTSLTIAACALFSCAIPAQANLVFNISYDSTVTGLANYTNNNIQNAVNYVANEFSSKYSDNITLNFTVSAITTGLGQSLFSNNYYSTNYAGVKTALTNDKTSADDTSFVNSLPASDPGTGLSWRIPSAEAKALGLITVQSTFDGNYSFNKNVTYTYDPNNRAVSGAYDFIGVTEHEFSELMGRTTQLGNAGFGYLPFDLARFTAANTRSLANTGNGVYFSVDNGTTNLKAYNGSGSGDVQDWDQSVASDPFDASTGTNQGHALTDVDYQTLDVIGYDLITPEPSLFIPAAGVIGFLMIRRKRATA